MIQNIRGELEKIAWKHYDPHASINVEEMLDEMIPVLDAHHNTTLKEIEEIIPKDDKAEFRGLINFTSNISKDAVGDYESFQYGFRMGYSCHQTETIKALHQKLIK